MNEPLNKIALLVLIINQLVYFLVFVFMFFWANVLTILTLTKYLIKGSIYESGLVTIYKKNFGMLRSLL